MDTRRRNNAFETGSDGRPRRDAPRLDANRREADYGQSGTQAGSASRRGMGANRHVYTYDRRSDFDYDYNYADARLRNARTTRRGTSTPPHAHIGGAVGVGLPRSNQAHLPSLIIAIAVLLVCLVLLFNLGSCIGRALAGSGGAAGQQSGAEASSQAEGAGEGTGASAGASAPGQSGTSSQAASSAAAASTTTTATAGDGVEDPWVEGGRFSTGDAELDQLVKTFCDGCADPNKSAADNAFTAYFTAVTTDYVESDDNQHPTGPTWDIQYAKQMLRKNTGNCYEFVAAVEYILKYFGYSDAQAEPCHVLLDSGSYGEHGLLYVTDLDGRKCLIDPSFAANGWMLDADSYTVRLADVGQDPSERTIANFEAVETANWITDGTTADSAGDAADADGEAAVEA